ncbi:MAG: lipopolysaccharide biosynthesis protein [Desulfobacteraceae bacterium]|jgi:O-antigen/teichoic acid export membrane protein
MKNHFRATHHRNGVNALFSGIQPALTGLFGSGALKSALSLADQLVVSATGFLSGVIVARHCTMAELGAYHLALSVFLILRGIQEQTITGPYTIYSHHRRNEALCTYTGSLFIHQVFFVITASLVLGALYLASLHNWTPEAFSAVAPMLLLAGPLVLIREFFRHYSFARLQFDAAFMADVSVLLLQLGGLYWMATLSGLTAKAVFGVVAVASGFAGIVWWVSARPHLRFDRRRVLPDWRQNWSFGRWTLLSYIVGCCTPYFVTWIVAGMRSEAEAGKLAACVSLIGLSNMFLTAIANVLTPKAAAVYAEEGLEGLGRVNRKVMLLFTVVLLFFTVLVFIFGNWLGRTVYGLAFGDIRNLCGLIALGIVVTSFMLVAGTALLAMDRPRANLPADATTAVVTIGLALYMVPAGGIIAAAAATLCGSVAGAAVRWATVFHYWRTTAVE